MLFTTHEINGNNNTTIECEWQRSWITLINKAKVKNVFEINLKKRIPIPKIIDNYNYNMNGVNIAN